MKDENKVIWTEELSEKLLDGNLETIRKYLRIYGLLSVNLALLRNAVLRKMAKPKTKGYPPGIFIAYRWESEEHKAWVFRLASYLRSKGYKVFFDQFEVDLQPEEFYQVPDFISSIVECQYFLIILSPGYIDNVTARKNKTSWVYDEYEQAILLVKNMMLKVRAVLVTGDEYLQICDRYNTVDLREYKEDFDRLGKIFPLTKLVYLDRQMRETLVEVLYHSDLFFYDGDFDNSYKCLIQYPDLIELFEVKLRLMRCLTIVGEMNTALEIAMSIKDEPGIDVKDILIITHTLVAAGEYTFALKPLLMLKKAINNRITVSTRAKNDDMAMKINYFDTHPDLVSDDLRALCYVQLGSVLDDLTSYHSAIQHYTVCLPLYAKHNVEGRSNLLNDIGTSYLRLQEYIIAVKYFKKAINLYPDNFNAYGSLVASLLALTKEKEAKAILRKAKKQFAEYDYNISDFKIDDSDKSPQKALIGTKKSIQNDVIYSCNYCKANFRLNHIEQCICGDCASVRSRQIRYCTVCGNDGIVPLRYLELKTNTYKITCPVCEKGNIRKRNGPSIDGK